MLNVFGMHVIYKIEDCRGEFSLILCLVNTVF